MEATHTEAECFSRWHRTHRRPDDLYCYRECSRVSLPPVSARIASIRKRADEFFAHERFHNRNCEDAIVHHRLLNDAFDRLSIY